MLSDFCVIGIDPSLTDTGICILERKLDVDIYYLSSIRGGKLRGVERLKYFKDSLQKVLEKINPSIAILEDYAFAISRGGRVFSLGELGGVLRLVLYENNIPFELVAPPQAKKFCTGKGIGEKSLLIKEVYKKWNVDTNNDNQADAYILAKIGEALLGMNEKPLMKYEQEVISKIRLKNTSS